SSVPVLTVSQCGLQYLLSVAAKQLQPVWAQRFLFFSSINRPPSVAPRFDSALVVCGISAASLAACCRSFAFLTLPVRVRTPFFALNRTCCLSRPLAISAAL